MSEDALCGVIVGRFYARWLGGDDMAFKGGRASRDYRDGLRKLNRTPIPVIVEVRRFGIEGAAPRYTVWVPGIPGYFALHDFEWHGDCP